MKKKKSKVDEREAGTPSFEKNTGCIPERGEDPHRPVHALPGVPQEQAAAEDLERDDEEDLLLALVLSEEPSSSLDKTPLPKFPKGTEASPQPRDAMTLGMLEHELPRQRVPLIPMQLYRLMTLERTPIMEAIWPTYRIRHTRMVVRQVPRAFVSNFIREVSALLAFRHIEGVERLEWVCLEMDSLIYSTSYTGIPLSRFDVLDRRFAHDIVRRCQKILGALMQEEQVVLEDIDDDNVYIEVDGGLRVIFVNLH